MGFLFFLCIVVIGICFYVVRNTGTFEINFTPCILSKIGVSLENQIEREVYQYCVVPIDLEQVMLEDATISFTKLTKDFQKTCLWDGGSCIYQGKNYQVISCHPIQGKNSIIITLPEKDYSEIIDAFCRDK